MRFALFSLLVLLAVACLNALPMGSAAGLTNEGSMGGAGAEHDREPRRGALGNAMRGALAGAAVGLAAGK
ncbi:unnamed protein product [Caenorhabditis auriculariae]|uniref:Uncharacterized protein n=1 Tax=Caenorhabditis auriculariae TaxID=2777116 RepID=A0A8S1HV18_9PELO|nr:unnamed protein product [Caenorhabditis auriculariae]